MKKENDLILTIFRFGLLLFFFNGFSQYHPLIKYYDGDLKLTERQVDSLIVQTIEESESNYLLALANYQKGVLQWKKGEDIQEFKSYVLAMEYLQKADTSDHYLISALWRNQGAILHNYKLYEEAVVFYQKALEASYRYSTSRGISTEYNIGLAMIQYDPKKALSLFLKLKDKAGEDLERKARIYNQLGSFQKRMERYEEAVIQYNKGLDLGITGKVRSDLLQNISDVFYGLGDYLNQEKYLLQVLEIPKGNRYLALMDLGECYLLQGRKEEAREKLFEAEKIYEDQPFRREYIKLFRWLKEVSEDPMFYAEKLIEEQAHYIDRMDELNALMKALAMKNMLAAVEAEERRKEETGLYRILAILGGLAALSILLTWKIWWNRLRNSLEKKIMNLTGH